MVAMDFFYTGGKLNNIVKASCSQCSESIKKNHQIEKYFLSSFLAWTKIWPEVALSWFETFMIPTVEVDVGGHTQDTWLQYCVLISISL